MSFTHTPPSFSFEEQQIATCMLDGQLWFAATDVCRALAITWSGATLRGIPKAWQKLVALPSSSGRQRRRYIAEPAVYKLAFRSNKPNADAFTNWVAREVLPAIRETGGYAGISHAPALPPMPAGPIEATGPALDCSQEYRRMREELLMITRGLAALTTHVRVFTPSGGSIGRHDLLRRISGCADRALASLETAGECLAEANALTRRLP